MNITTTFTNASAGQVLHVLTDRSGIWFESAQVLSVRDNEMGRSGSTLSKDQTEKLLNYWKASGHEVCEK